MGKRREGREAAVQFLYQLDLNARELSATALDFWQLRSAPGANLPADKLQNFTAALVQGVGEHLAEIDERISRYAANYELGRLAAVDRNILRVAIFEMLFSPEVPPVVAINEAIEIAKRFGSEESSKFVNGVLDRVKADLSRSPRVATPKP